MTQLHHKSYKSYKHAEFSENYLHYIDKLFKNIFKSPKYVSKQQNIYSFEIHDL